MRKLKIKAKQLQLQFRFRIRILNPIRWRLLDLLAMLIVVIVIYNLL